MPYVSHHPQAWHDRSKTLSAAPDAASVFLAPKSATVVEASASRSLALWNRFAHLSDALRVFFRVEISAPIANATAAASIVLVTEAAPIVRGRMVHETTIAGNGTASDNLLKRQKATLNSEITLGGAWVIAAAVLLSAPALTWVAAFTFFPTLAVIFIGALLCALIIYGIAMSFADVREEIAAGASEVEL